MNLPQAIVTCLKKSFTFSGRASRSEYWYFVLFQIILGIVLGFVDGLLYNVTLQEFLYDINRPWGFSDIVPLLLYPASISVTVRRLHDVNRSGWWCWISCTIIGIFFPLFYWYVQPSTDGNNDYGKKPE